MRSGMGLKKFVNRLRKRYFLWQYGDGDDYHCVFCGGSCARFLPAGHARPAFERLDVVGGGLRENGKCPRCSSNNRARLVLLYLKTQTKIFETATRLLHIAPDGSLAAALARADTIDYVCGGLNLDPIRAYHPLKIDVTAIPFEEDSFDTVLCNHVMSDVRNDELGFREIHRILHPGGMAILQVPIALKLTETQEAPEDMRPAEIARQFGHSEYIRMYGPDYDDKLRHVGFRVERHNPFEEKWLPDIERHGLDSREWVYACVKA